MVRREGTSNRDLEGERVGGWGAKGLPLLLVLVGSFDTMTDPVKPYIFLMFLSTPPYHSVPIP